MTPINWKFVGDCVKFVGKGVAYGLSLASLFGTKVTIKRTYESGYVGYYDAIDSVMESDMLDSYKNEIVDMIKTNAEPRYYKSVITVIASDMLDSYKRDTIKKLH